MPPRASGGSSLWRPYLWLAVFFLVPFLIVLKISLSQTAIAQPPYTPVLDLAAGWHGLQGFLGALSLDNYALLAVRSDSTSSSYLRSLEIAAISTALLLLIGYPDRLRHGARAARAAGRSCSCWWCCRSGPRS